MQQNAGTDADLRFYFHSFGALFASRHDLYATKWCKVPRFRLQHLTLFGSKQFLVHHVMTDLTLGAGFRVTSHGIGSHVIS